MPGLDEDLILRVAGRNLARSIAGIELAGRRAFSLLADCGYGKSPRRNMKYPANAHTVPMTNG
jgi:hypothetical protein